MADRSNFFVIVARALLEQRLRELLMYCTKYLPVKSVQTENTANKCSSHSLDLESLEVVAKSISENRQSLAAVTAFVIQ